MISVEQVVSQRFPSFNTRNPAFRKTVLGTLKFLFRENEFQRFEISYSYLSGFDFVEQVLEYFDFDYQVSERERANIPGQGRVVIIANHPIGSLDGLALLKLVGEVRRDVKVVANEVLSQLAPLSSLLLPVDNMGNRTGRDNIRAIDQHLQQEGAVIIFPAGEVSRMGLTGVRDSRWRQGFLRFARKAKAPIVPMHVDARNSVLFYSLSLFARPLSTLWLVREMFKHASGRVTVRVGPQIEYASYAELPLSNQAVVKLFRRHVYKLGQGRLVEHFRNHAEAIAHPEDRQALRSEIRRCERLGKTREGMDIYLYRFQDDSSVMREIGRLREVSFRAVGEGSGRRRDIDRFDRDYDHIVLWDDEALELVGAYRLRRTARSDERALYSATLFEYLPPAQRYLDCGVELGRSFVQPRYWGRRSLDCLWYGIGAYVRRYPELRYLFGPVSISNSMPQRAKDLLVSFYSHYFPSTSAWAVARMGYRPAQLHVSHWQGQDYGIAFTRLKAELSELGVSVPTLYKQYTELCEDSGVQFAAFNVDPDFSDCLDGLVLVDLHYLKDSRRKRYLGESLKPAA